MIDEQGPDGNFSLEVISKTKRDLEREQLAHCVIQCHLIFMYCLKLYHHDTGSRNTRLRHC